MQANASNKQANTKKGSEDKTKNMPWKDRGSGPSCVIARPGTLLVYFWLYFWYTFGIHFAHAILHYSIKLYVNHYTIPSNCLRFPSQGGLVAVSSSPLVCSAPGQVRKSLARKKLLHIWSPGRGCRSIHVVLICFNNDQQITSDTNKY